MRSFGFAPAELRVFRRLNTPDKIQRFLDEETGYNTELDGETLRSPRRVLRDRTAHCMEGALFAAAAFRMHELPALVIWLEAVRDDDHLVAPFHQDGRWGAVAKSNYSGLRYRAPVYRTVRELVMSYFDHYFNLRREKTLRAYSRPINLTVFDRTGWMTAEDDLWTLNDSLYRAPRVRILTPELERRRMWMDDRLFAAGCLGSVK